MCGIFGEVGKKLSSKEEFLTLRNLMHDRGPDSDGYWSDEQSMRFGFKRLAILDLSDAGNQPMVSKNGEWILVMNGEVYNYQELHKQIGSPVLRSGTDTEVVLELFQSVGFVDGIKRLNGMYALALYHLPTGKLYLGRDFAGIKPLFYGVRENTIVFASQFNQLFKHPLFAANLELREDVMKEYFAFGYQHAPNTVFKDIMQLKPGEYLVWDNLSCELELKSLYFNWKDNPINFETNRDMTDMTNTVIKKVVKSQLNAHVPVATFLSGGIDSPLITAHATSQYRRIQAFTVKVDDEKYNESELAAKYADHLQIKQIIESFTEDDLLKEVEEHFRGMSEPLGDYSSIPTYLITKRAKQYATVMLSGDGGDELFWGYPRFLYFSQQAKYFKLSLSIRKLLMPVVRKFKGHITHALDVVDNFGDMVLYKHIHNHAVDKLFPKVAYSKELLDDYEFNGTNSLDALLYLRKNEFYAHLQRVLRKVDLMSMSNSLEVRVPFLDLNTIQFSLNIIPQLGISHNKPKLLLKKCLETFIPKQLIDVKKRGFSVPIERWMRNQLRSEITKHLIDMPIYGASKMQQEILREQVHGFFDNRKVHGFMGKKNVNAWGIWHMYVWQKWAVQNNLL